MLTPDFINGSLEFASACLVLVNVRRLILDKKVLGVSLIPTALFDFWGFWNLYYYSHLNQWASLTGGGFLLVANVWWTALAFYYGRGKPEPAPKAFMRVVGPPHADDCDWHFEQYDWECTCGLTTPPREYPDTDISASIACVQERSRLDEARYEQHRLTRMG